MLVNVMGMSTLCGLNNAVSTEASQAYGSGQFKLCGVHLNRARVLVLLIFVVLLIPFQFANRAFLLLGLDSQSAQFAQDYANIACIAIFFNGLADAHKRMLNCFGYQSGPMVISLGIAGFHLLACYILSLYFGVYGPAIAQSLSNTLYFIAITLYAWRLKDANLELAKVPLSRDSLDLRGLHEFMKIGGPSIVMTCLEWWSFELMTVIASYISIPAVATQIIIINNSHVFFMPHFGICIAANILIGEHIGARKVQKAKLYHKMLHLLGGLQSVILATFLFTMRVPISQFYTNIPDLQEDVAHVLTIYAFYHLLDGNKAVASGVMRGLAKQAQGSIVSMLSYYVVSLPFQYLFGFHL